jgi:hypothetical protein
MCEDFAPNFGDTSFLTSDFFYQKQYAYRPYPPYSSLFPRLKIKLESRHFHTIGVIEEESQAVLYTLTEHD